MTGPEQVAEMRAGVKFAIVATLLFFVAAFALIIYQIEREARRSQAPCALCDAVAAEDPSRVRSALDAGGIDVRAWRSALERVHSTTDRGGPPLEIARLLAERGADPNYTWTTPVSSGKGAKSSTEYWAAAIIGEDSDAPDAIHAIEAMLAHGLDSKGPAGGEALVAAARQAHARSVARLLEAGVSPNYVGRYPRRTALAEAIQTRDAATIAALEAMGAREW